MEALVLERKNELTLRDIEIAEPLGPHDVRIAIRTVGICGSDVHYYTHGAIGPFVVRAPMVLGHEAAGVIVEVGAEVKNLQTGDHVCMEPGIPDPCTTSTPPCASGLRPRCMASCGQAACIRPTIPSSCPTT